MAAQSYTSVLRDRMPAFLLGTWGEKWVSVFGVLFDYLRDRAREGTKAHFPTECDVTLLPTHGWERGIERADGELDDDYRARIHAAPVTYKWAGTDKGVLAGLATLGWKVSGWFGTNWPTDWGEPDNAWFAAARDWGTSTPDGDAPTPNWARFWVVLDWYGRFGNTPIPTSAKASTSRVVRKWKASRSPCRGVIYITSDGGWGDIRGQHVLRAASRIRGGVTEVVVP